ncbi:LacI family DNA-binding transcriptional regulator [Sinomonas notoginsengisoli]|uniref:LacI family DNA-binding transcriptional regulator n=1 Tax=Sinomonas notoginsengisoli TaxID=1457311 RepID=UPI001F3D2C3A|nr:LacI family DNA-binding transcriptional regulator [Sinomonas notoginsengisoli]
MTSRDVAKLAGVSQATVSRLISSPSKLAPSTMAKVRAAMEELGYVPHLGAQSMKTRRSNTVGVVVAELTNPFYSEVLDQLSRELDRAGLRVVIWNAGGGSHVDALKAISEHAVDGVIFTTATEDSLELRAAIEKGSPIVLINRSVEGLECDQVTSDNVSGGVTVADYLVRHGRQRVAFIGGTENAKTSRDRAQGFLGRMAELGHPVPEHCRFTGNFDHGLSAQIMERVLARGDSPEAVFCANDFMAFGVLDALRRAGRTSCDCWVIGYDDVDMAAWASFSLTTVRQPSRAMASAGVRLLVERLKSPSAPARRVDFPSELIVRGSSELAPA